MLGVFCALTLTDEIQEILGTEYSWFCWTAAICDSAMGSLAAAGQKKMIRSMLCFLGKK